MHGVLTWRSNIKSVWDNGVTASLYMPVIPVQASADLPLEYETSVLPCSCTRLGSRNNLGVTPLGPPHCLVQGPLQIDITYLWPSSLALCYWSKYAAKRCWNTRDHKATSNSILIYTLLLKRTTLPVKSLKINWLWWYIRILPGSLETCGEWHTWPPWLLWSQQGWKGPGDGLRADVGSSMNVSASSWRQRRCRN